MNAIMLLPMLVIPAQQALLKKLLPYADAWEIVLTSMGLTAIELILLNWLLSNG